MGRGGGCLRVCRGKEALCDARGRRVAVEAAVQGGEEGMDGAVEGSEGQRGGAVGEEEGVYEGAVLCKISIPRTWKRRVMTEKKRTT